MVAGVPPGLTSVIVACRGGLEAARACVGALARHTRRPWELVAVDVGPADGTATYLAGVRDAAPFPVNVVAAAGLDLPAARGRGLAAARGEYLVLLDDDAVVTDAWLDQLVALADSDPAIGMAGPMSNGAGPPQRVAAVPYADAAGMDRFAAEWRSRHRGEWLESSALSGPCVLIKRRALGAAVGPAGAVRLDDDAAVRVRAAGFRTVVAVDLYVHREDGRTSAGAGLDVAASAGEDPGRRRAIPAGPVPRGGPPPAAADDLPGDYPVPLLPLGTAREMVTRAIGLVAGLAGTAGRKAALWERLAGQVFEHGRRNGSTWGMDRLRGADASIIYQGRASEYLVLDASGRLFRGRGPGCLAGSRGGALIPDYAAMRPVG